MKHERIAIADLSLDPSNVRKHGDRNIQAIVASLRKFGQQKPVVVSSDNVVIAGNGTVQAAKSIGWKEVDIVRTDLRGAEATAYAIADNRTADLAEWDEGALAETLAALQNDDSIDHLAAGFTDDEIAALINGPDFAPGSEDDQGRLDELAPKMTKCPSCGHEYDLRDHE
jgi:ParB-like chromosome segregation protein Spo0J